MTHGWTPQGVLLVLSALTSGPTLLLIQSLRGGDTITVEQAKALREDVNHMQEENAQLREYLNVLFGMPSENSKYGVLRRREALQDAALCKVNGGQFAREVVCDATNGGWEPRPTAAEGEPQRYPFKSTDQMPPVPTPPTRVKKPNE